MKSKNIPYFEFNTKQQDIVGWHDSIEITFILRGQGLLELNGNVYSLKEKDILVINICQLHRLEFIDRGAAISFYIPSEYLAQYAPEEINHFWECASFLGSQGSQEYFDIIRRAFCELFIIQKTDDDLEFRGKVLLLLKKLDEYFLKDEENERINRNKQFALALRYLAEHFREDITLSELAKVTHFSESYLSRLFRKELGISYKQYLIKLRVSKGLAFLKNTELSITEIAYMSGFNSTNSFIASFKQIYKTTPGQYKTKLKKKKRIEENSLFSQENAILNSLFQYREETRMNSVRTQTIEIDASLKGKKLNHTWKRLLNVAYAQDILTARVQEQLTKIQKEIPFYMARFLGICNDSMMVFHKDKDGNVTFHFDLVDQVLDFLLSVNLKPFIVIGFMPEALAKKKYRAYFNPTYVSLPNDMSTWNNMVESLLYHMIERYGEEEVRNWVFQLWNHPEVGMMIETYTMEEYLNFYKETYHTIKKADPNIKVAGPGCKIESWDFLEIFLQYCKENFCIPELLCFESYHFEETEEQRGSLPFIRREDTLNGIISSDPHYLLKRYDKLKAILETMRLQETCVMLSNWNSTSWQRDFCNDTAYKAAFMYRDLWQTYDMWYAIGYWFILDYVSNDEVPPSIEFFHGGFGLLTSNGIPKSGYRALQLLNRAGDRMLLNEDGIAVTSCERKNKLGIYLYNCCEYKDEYRYQHTSEISYYKRYVVFKEKETIFFRIHIRNMESGICTIHQYKMGPKAGSAYEEWIKMGAPENMTQEELEFLLTRTMPDYHTERISYNQELLISIQIEPHEIAYLEVILK